MSLFSPLPKFQLYHKSKTLDLSTPKVMGILNVTPDSFSDGGRYNSIDNALTRCQQMLFEGATIIDIGGESTRPNATPISTDEEIKRVVPVVSAIRKHLGSEVWLSVDTSSPEVIKAAVAAGADIWNDVRALKRQGAIDMAAQLNVPVMLMHMRGEPDTMDSLANYDDAINEIVAELKTRIDEVVAGGVSRSCLMIDPGFGFAKNHQHHCELMTRLADFKTFDLPIMFGISRKRFLGEVLTNSNIPAWLEGDGAFDISTSTHLNTFNKHIQMQAKQNRQDKTQRDNIGVAAALLAVQQGASIIRTHNVAMTTEALTLWTQLSNWQNELL